MASNARKKDDKFSANWDDPYRIRDDDGVFNDGKLFFLTWHFSLRKVLAREFLMRHPKFHE